MLYLQTHSFKQGLKKNQKERLQCCKKKMNQLHQRLVYKSIQPYSKRKKQDDGKSNLSDRGELRNYKAQNLCQWEYPNEVHPKGPGNKSQGLNRRSYNHRGYRGQTILQYHNR